MLLLDFKRTLSPPGGSLENYTCAHKRVCHGLVHQRAYKQHVLECLARYRVEKMPYLIPPKHYPSGHEKVCVRSSFPSFLSLFVLRLSHSVRPACVLRW